MTSDWRDRPASADSTSYLSSASSQLLQVKACQAKELQLLAELRRVPSHQLVSQVYSSCQEASLRLYAKPPALKAARSPVEKLLKWRDWTARQLDESPEYILPVAALAEVAGCPERAAKFIAPCAEVYVPYVRQFLQAHKTRAEAGVGGGLFETAGWVSRELPYSRDFALISQSSTLRPEIFNTGLAEDCDADDLRVCLEVFKQFNSRVPLLQSGVAAPLHVFENPEDLDSQLDSLDIDENEIPSTMKQIYELSNRNRKKNKTKVKGLTPSEVSGPLADVNLPALVKTLGWGCRSQRR
jgi:hypothetical protein